MRGAFDNHPIEIECPECEATTALTVGDARKSPTLTCPNGHEIAIDGSQLEQSLTGIDSALADIPKSVEIKLG